MPDSQLTVPIFTTDRLQLRPVTLDDLGVLTAMQTDPAVMGHYGDGLPLTRADAEATVSVYHVRCRAHDYWAWAVARAGSGQVLGQVTAGWDPLDGAPAVALGYILARSAWGRGYGTEAVTAVVRHGLNHLGWPCVWAAVSPATARSLRLCEKVGLSPAGEQTNTHGGLRRIFRTPRAAP